MSSLEYKKVVFESSQKRYIDMRIKLSYDGLTQKLFFQNIVSAYVDGDPNIATFVEALKDKLSSQSVKNRARTKNLTAASNKAKRNYALTEGDKEEIFDLISEEIGDL